MHLRLPVARRLKCMWASGEILGSFRTRKDTARGKRSTMPFRRTSRTGTQPSQDAGKQTEGTNTSGQSNGMIYRGKKSGVAPSSDELVMRYHARELYAVMNVEHGRPSRVYIGQDGKDLTRQNKGVDVRFDAEGHSYLEVREPRMYYLTANPTSSSHKVELFPTRSGLTINSFTFGNDCQTQFSHL